MILVMISISLISSHVLSFLWSFLDTTENFILHIQRKYQVLFAYHVTEPPRPRVHTSPSPHVPESPHPRVHTSPSPHVPESTRLRVLTSPSPHIPRVHMSPTPHVPESTRPRVLTYPSTNVTEPTRPRVPYPMSLSQKMTSYPFLPFSESGVLM